MATTSPDKSTTTDSALSRPRFLIVLALIGALGLVVRVVDLTGAPPGLHFDQAANGLLGLEILAGQHPVFFSSYTGREALFMYVIAALVKVLGPNVVALRLAGALAGAATVVALGLLGAEIGSRRVGLLAAAFLAGLYWHIHISRLGERTILVPLLDVLALWALWQAFRSEEPGSDTGRRTAPVRFAWAIVGGGLVGLQLYTYPSSRFFVGVVGLAAAIGVLGWFVGERRQVRVSTGLFCLALVAGLLATVPLALHFWHVPDDFLGRADQVAIWTRASTPAAALPILENSVVRTLAMFLFSGDADWKYNLAGRPVFDPLSGAFFLLGLAAAFWRIRRPAERLCLIWLVGMLAPGFLSVDAPQFMRTLGAAPPAALLAGRGVALAVDWLRRRPIPLRLLAPVLLAWPAVAGGIATYQYFTVWAPSAPAYYALEGDVTDAVAIVQSQAPKYATTYVASRYGPDPTVAYLAGDVFPKLRWFDGRSALPMPPPGSGPTLYVLPSTAADTSWYQTLPASARVAEVKGPDGAPSVEAFVLEPDQSVGSGSNLASPLRFGNLATLVAADVPRAMQPGLTIAPLLTWRLDSRPNQPVKFFLHLVDSAGQRWTQYDEEVYPAADWQPGQLLLVRRPIHLPNYLPPGRYTLEVGIERADGTPLGAVDASGRGLGSYWRSPVVEAIRPEHPPSRADLNLGQPMNVAFGGVARLIGVNETTTKVQDGDNVALTLTWQVLATPKGNLTTVIQGVDASGKTVGETTAPPTGGVWPATEWQPGDVVVDHQQYLVPAGDDLRRPHPRGRPARRRRTAARAVVERPGRLAARRGRPAERDRAPPRRDRGDVRPRPVGQLRRRDSATRLRRELHFGATRPTAPAPAGLARQPAPGHQLHRLYPPPGRPRQDLGAARRPAGERDPSDDDLGARRSHRRRSRPAHPIRRAPRYRPPGNRPLRRPDRRPPPDDRRRGSGAPGGARGGGKEGGG